MINKLITSFLEDLQSKRRRSDRTARNYDFYLRRFGQWLASRKISSPEKITGEAVKQYAVWLKRVVSPIKKIKLKGSTQNYHLIAVRAFLRYLAKKKIKSLSAINVRLAKLPPAAAPFLENAAMEKLLSAPNKINQDKLFQLRDRAILELLYCSGLRVSEVSSLTVKDINLSKNYFITKDKLIRKIPLSNQARYWIAIYFKLRKDKNKFLFIGHDRALNKRNESGLTPRSVERIVDKYRRSAGIGKKITPKILRRSFAMSLLRSGASPEEVTRRLGHLSKNTAKNYLK